MPPDRPCRDQRSQLVRTQPLQATAAAASAVVNHHARAGSDDVERRLLVEVDAGFGIPATGLIDDSALVKPSAGRVALGPLPNGGGLLLDRLYDLGEGLLRTPGHRDDDVPNRGRCPGRSGRVGRW